MSTRIFEGSPPAARVAEPSPPMVSGGGTGGGPGAERGAPPAAPPGAVGARGRAAAGGAPTPALPGGGRGGGRRGGATAERNPGDRLSRVRRAGGPRPGGMATAAAVQAGTSSDQPGAPFL